MSQEIIEHIKDKIFSVEEYLELVNELLGPLKVSVEGEITDLKILPQWVFFSLKDAESGCVLRCGLHSGVYRRLGVNVEEGMSVRIFGYGKISPKTGNFGFWVSKIEPIGEGALKKAYELLLKKLEKEGLFARKRELPEFISHIGVISSRNGVVVQDLMKNLKPLGIKIDFIHSGVEGADSASEILRAIKHFSNAKEKPQVLVLIRGGGSLESLQGFNNEAVVRAIYAAPMPVLVGIGHDVDAPIATLVADWSASTPTAVAHVINESWSAITETVPLRINMIFKKFAQKIRSIEHRSGLAQRSMSHAISNLFSSFKRYEENLIFARSKILKYISDTKEKTNEFTNRTFSNMEFFLKKLSEKLDDYERVLTLSNPENILKKGYGIVYGKNGKLVRSVKQVNIGDTVVTHLFDGNIESVVNKKQ